MFSFLSLTSIVATALVYQILIMDGSDYWTTYEDVYRKWENRSKVSHDDKSSTVSVCPPFSIHTKPFSTRSASCRLPVVRKEACSFAKSIFTMNPANQSCNTSQVNLCRMEKTPRGSPKVECHTTSCGSSDIISVGFIYPRDGSLSWRHFSFLQDVEKALNKYIQSAPAIDYFPFAFLRCDEFWNPTAKTQLFLLPPRGATADKSRDKFHVKAINVNIMLIDSVSRPHFFRSLPQTVKAFRSINANTSALVLDFELFHGIKHRTFENINALFSGELLDIDQFVNPVPVKADVMFNKFKSLGYQTMWQEDLCWTYEWGLVRDFKVMNQSLPLKEIWHNLTSTLKKNSIDFTGITHSSCEVFKNFGVPEPFHGPSTICYGGKHYHHLFLNFLENFLQEVNMDSDKKPLFSFSMLNVGHEESGLRIQTFDEGLANFVENLGTDPNTLSIILSDHGNTYGAFPATMEGRFEVFQPHLFIIIPNRVQNLLGKNRVLTLQQNQKRLVSIIDLHYTLMAVASDIGSKGLQQHLGLFEPISRKRSCEDLQLLSSSICICQGWYTKVQANSFHYIIAEIVLGQLNGKIQTQFLENIQTKRPVSGFGSCERLKGERFDNVREKRNGEILTVSLDMYVQRQELFSATVQVIMESVLIKIKLVQYTRFSEYGIYQSCADKGVDLRLCICGQRKTKHYSTTQTYLKSVSRETFATTKEPPTPKWQHYGSVFDSVTIADEMHKNCLFILLREHKSGVVMEAANSCSFVTYTIEVHFSLSNMQVSERTPVCKEVGPGAIHFLIAVIPLDPGINWSWKYTVNFSWKMIR